MSNSEEGMAVQSMLSATLSPCGLNADWCVRAWHLGPSDRPNLTSGDYYLLDDEESTTLDSYALVRRTFEENGENDTVTVVVQGTLGELLKQLVALNAPRKCEEQGCARNAYGTDPWSGTDLCVTHLAPLVASWEKQEGARGR